MIEVEAVKDQSQRTQIETLLSGKDPIYGDVWKFLLNTALRISDALSITMAELDQLDIERPCLRITERKTGKKRCIALNTGALAVIRKRQEQHPNDVWLFQSTSSKVRRKDPKHINRRSVGRVLESIGGQIIPKVKLGTHSARKTRGYVLFSNGHSIEKISKILNHSSPVVTMRYIGITQSDIDDSFTDLVL